MEDTTENKHLFQGQIFILFLKKKKIPKGVLFAIDNDNHLRNLYYLFKDENVGFFYRDKNWIIVDGYKDRMTQNDFKLLENSVPPILKLDNVNYFNFKDEKPSAVEKGDQFQVLTYISKNREKYYGWDEIMSAAQEHKDIAFTVVGTDGLEDAPENVNCLGWVKDMDALFEKAHCTIRFVEHDGLSGFVLESLFRGKQVLYSEPLKNCIHVKSTSEISDALGRLKEKYSNDEPLLNTEGIKYVKDNFNREYILNRLIEKFKS